MKNFLYLFLLNWAAVTESMLHTSARNQNQENKMEFHLNNSKIHWKVLGKINRSKRSSAESCNGNATLFYDQAVRYCCKKCPAGEYVGTPCLFPGGESKCIACGSGTYLEHPNYLSRCRACHYCHIETQIIAKNCSATANTQCKCNEGRYRKEEQCLTCTKCVNRETLRNCSQNKDAECGQCLSGFYEDQDKCQPCPQTLQKPCENQTDVTCTILCSPLSTGKYVKTIVFLAHNEKFVNIRSHLNAVDGHQQKSGKSGEQTNADGALVGTEWRNPTLRGRSATH
ncbi:tumor necrosis factor receptor superfamily member 25-like isoform X1 [Xenopus laevis]|uniref:Tumor necrosis factor receptor superfamily member 25-like isoform X1 n=1 Tax=Xenopus laevis TaxID=8355 RepID=A0A8J1LD07_XENLA|nr:tumor necrosis factor receptor superfamily member 25-like isoform X1 [Xenopus laevis]